MMLEKENKIPVDSTIIPPWTKPVDGMHMIYADKEDQYRIQMKNHIVYVKRDRELHMDILSMNAPLPEKKYPVVIYIPGSGWMEQEIYDRIPELVEIARCGYIVVNMEYRHTEEGALFPSQVEDAKSAIRFIRAHAEELHADPERIAIWGDSSGAHTALMAALSKENEYITNELKDFSTKVSCIIDFFGPTDFLDAAKQISGIDHITEKSIEGKLLGAAPMNVPELARKANPVNCVVEGREYPPLLIVHGDRDNLIPFSQSVLLYEKYKSNGQPCDFYMVRNGAHGFKIWTKEVMDITKKFLRAYL